MQHQGVELIVIDLRGYDIHIDGHFLIVDVDLALVWARGISDETRDALMGYGVEIVEIDYDRVQLNGGGIHCSTCPLIRDSIDQGGG